MKENVGAMIYLNHPFPEGNTYSYSLLHFKHSIIPRITHHFIYLQISTLKKKARFTKFLSSSQ